MESTLLPATLFSLLLHCVIAALLILCIRESRLISIPQMIISVDISTLETEREEKPPVVLVERKSPEVKSLPEPQLPVKSIQPPLKKAEAVPMPVPAPLQSPVIPAEATPSTQPGQTMSYSQRTITPAPIISVNPSHPGTAVQSVKVPPQPGNAHADVKQEQAYLAILKEMIERSKEYPLMARRGGMEGTVRIRCALGRNGDLQDAAVIKPSGYTILDKAALRAVRSAGRFPRVPSEIRGEAFSFVAPITFRLAVD